MNHGAAYVHQAVWIIECQMKADYLMLAYRLSNVVSRQRLRMFYDPGIDAVRLLECAAHWSRVVEQVVDSFAPADRFRALPKLTEIVTKLEDGVVVEPCLIL